MQTDADRVEKLALTGSVEPAPGAPHGVPVAALPGVAVVGWLAFTPQLFNDGDTAWHLAAGRWITANGRVPHSDPFSFTHLGQPWTAHEWLAELAMSGTLAVAGWAGLAFLCALAVGCTMWICAKALPLPARYNVLLQFGLFGTLAQFSLARPHVLAWPMLALWTYLLARVRDGKKSPPAVVGLLMLPWANLHASYILGLGLVGLFAVEALLESRDFRSTMKRWAPFGLVATVAASVTPHGVQGFLYPFQVSSMEALSIIMEWRGAKLPTDLAFFVFATVVWFFAIRRWQALGIVRWILLLGLTYLAMKHARHQALFGILTYIAVLPRVLDWRERSSSWFPLAAAGLGLILALRLAVPLQRENAPSWPSAALAQVPPQIRSRPVFNSYIFGGPLIFHGISPVIDGRADMYGDAHTLWFHRVEQGDLPAFRKAVERYGIAWTILLPQAPLAKLLDQEPRWKRVYADGSAVIHVLQGQKEHDAKTATAEHQPAAVAAAAVR